MSSRVEDLRDLAQMLDEGKITQSEYDLVKKELLEAPADDWEIELDVADPEGSVEESDGEGEAGPSWRAHLGEIPTRYRAALVVALVVLVAGRPFEDPLDRHVRSGRQAVELHPVG